MEVDDLTTADGFALVEATYYDRIAGERYERDKTESVSIDRWTKHGKDRLYLNGLKTGDGWLSLVDGSSGGDRWTKVEAVGRVDGDTLTIKVGNMSTSYKDFGELEACYDLVVRVEGVDTDEGDDSNEQHEDQTDTEMGDCREQNTSETEDAVADGGVDPSGHVDDETIEAALADEREAEHLSVATIRAVLADVQRGVAATWGRLLDRVREGDVQLLSAGDGYVFATAHGGELDVSIEHSEAYQSLEEADQDAARRVVRLVHHDLAADRTEHEWGHADPLVVGESGLDGRDGVALVEAYLNGLVARGASPGQAWSYYGVEVRGNSQSAWARRQDRTQSQVQKGVAAVGTQELGY